MYIRNIAEVWKYIGIDRKTITEPSNIINMEESSKHFRNQLNGNEEINKLKFELPE